MTLRIWLRRLKRRYLEHRAIVLMYHRVARLETDPWELAVDPVNFEQQLQVLKKRFYVAPVNELLLQLQQGSIKRNCVCITFDDGYSDNFFNAKPLLEKYSCPAAFFIATRLIGLEQLFWWDELQQLLLEVYRLPPVFSVVIQGEPFIYHLQEDALLNVEKRRRQQSWIYTDDPPTRRCELYLLLWHKLRPLPYTEQQQVLHAIRSWAGGFNGAHRGDLPLTSFQLNHLASHPLFDVSLHTATHASLPFLPKEMQRLEINNNREALSQFNGRGSKVLTYPYGDYNDATIEVAKEAHLTAAFTACERPVTQRSDLFSLGRYQVRNWNGPDFEKQLSTWIKTY